MSQNDFDWRCHITSQDDFDNQEQPERWKIPQRRIIAKYKPWGNPLGDIPPSQLKPENIPLTEDFFYPALLLLYKQIRSGKVDPKLENFVRTPFQVIPDKIHITNHAVARFQQRNTNPKIPPNTHTIKTIIRNSIPAKGNTSLMVMRLLNNIRNNPGDAELPVVLLSDGQWVIPISKRGSEQYAVTIYRPKDFHD